MAANHASTVDAVTDDLAEFVREYWSIADDGVGLLWTLAGDQKRSCWFEVGNEGDVADAIATMADQVGKADCYYGVATRRQILDRGRRGGDVDCLHQLAVVADLDVAGPGHRTDGALFPNVTSAINVARGLSLLPTFIVHSAGGIQSGWCFAEPEDARDPFIAGLRRRLIETLKRLAGEYAAAVDDTQDAARVMRLPGTLNLKEGLSRPTALLDRDWRRRYNPTELDEALDELVPELPKLPPSKRAGNYADEVWPGTAYNNKVPASDPLIRAGFQLQRSDRAGNEYYVRPGKDLRDGHSAVVYANDGHTTIYSTTPRQTWPTLEVRRPYDAFGLYAHLHADGDFGRASKQLADEGFGEPDAARIAHDIVVTQAITERQQEVAEVTGNVITFPTSAASSDGPKAVHDTGGPDPDRPRPKIVTNNVELRDVRDQTVAAIEAWNRDSPHLFVRGGVLVSIQPDENGRPVITPVTEAALRSYASDAAIYVRTLKAKDDGSPSITLVPPPTPVLQSILAIGGWPLPALEGVTEAPILRPDGSVRTANGYDPQTRLFYWPSQQLEGLQVAEHPTEAEAVDALRTLSEPLCDFPFADKPSRANALGMILTAVLRPAIPGATPLHVIDATSPGTGKGLLTDVVAIIATGKTAAGIAWPDEEEEARKRITSALMEGAPIMALDNIEGPLRSSRLASALTMEVWSDRLLGKSQSVNVPIRCTWIANGNGVALRGDLPRRGVWVRLDAATAEPWTRKGFAHPELAGWVKEHRRELVAAAMTMARRWFTLGCPAPSSPRVGSYERWSNIVGGILEACEVGWFLGNASERYEVADNERADWEPFLERLEERFPLSFSAGEVKALIDVEMNDWADLVPSSVVDTLGQNRFARRLGEALTTRAGRRWNRAGLRVERAGQTRTKSALWKVTRDLTPRDPADPADAEEAAGESAGSRGLAGSISPYPLEKNKRVVNKRIGAQGEKTPRDPADPAAPAEAAIGAELAPFDPSARPDEF